VAKIEIRDHLIRNRHRWEGNINIDFKDTSIRRSEPDLTSDISGSLII
jgi:hypothetical protein